MSIAYRNIQSKCEKRINMNFNATLLIVGLYLPLDNRFGIKNFIVQIFE